MQADNFRSMRRQKFLSEPYFELNIVDIARSIDNKREGIVSRRARGNFDPVGQAGIFQDKLDLLKLYYTAGRPIDEIQPLYSDALTAFENWNEDYREYIKSIAIEDGEDLRTDGTPLRFEDLYDFQLALNMVSLGVLLGDGNAIRKFAKCVERFRGTDLLFESLIERAVTDPRDNTDFFHVSPYAPLIDAYYTVETPEEASTRSTWTVGTRVSKVHHGTTATSTRWRVSTCPTTATGPLKRQRSACCMTSMTHLSAITCSTPRTSPTGRAQTIQLID